MLVVLVSASRALLAWGATAADLPAPPENSIVRELAAWDAVPPSPYQWDPETLDFVVFPKPVPTMSTLTFQWRYTLAEQVAIDRASEEHPDPNVRATLRILDKSLMRANDADVTDLRTIQGVQYHASLGLIQPARVAEILAPVVA
jgi:hypothetical protein